MRVNVQAIVNKVRWQIENPFASRLRSQPIRVLVATKATDRGLRPGRNRGRTCGRKG